MISSRSLSSIVGVPGALGINHDDRPFLVAIHASGGVDADVVLLVGNAEFLDLVLHVIARLLCTVVVAASVGWASFIICPPFNRVGR